MLCWPDKPTNATAFYRTFAKSRSYKKHKGVCDGSFTGDDVTILGSNCKGEKYLLTLEALFQNDIKPSLNTKDEYKSRTLTIKFEI